jgi:hypothetical protein
MMHGDVFFLAERTKLLDRKLERIIHQTSNLQFEIPEAIRRELLPPGGNWHLSIWPKEGGNVLLIIIIAVAFSGLSRFRGFFWCRRRPSKHFSQQGCTWSQEL